MAAFLSLNVENPFTIAYISPKVGKACIVNVPKGVNNKNGLKTGRKWPLILVNKKA